MTPSRFYRLAIFLPLAVPVMAFPAFVLAGGRQATSPFARAVSLSAVLTLGAATAAIIPYFVTAVPLVIWMRRRPLVSMRRALLASPILMLVPLSLFLCGVAVHGGGWDALSDQRSWAFVATAGCLIVAFGYPYVALVLVIGRWLDMRREPTRDAV
jgi:hypothetical protein